MPPEITHPKFDHEPVATNPTNWIMDGAMLTTRDAYLRWFYRSFAQMLSYFTRQMPSWLQPELDLAALAQALALKHISKHSMFIPQLGQAACVLGKRKNNLREDREGKAPVQQDNAQEVHHPKRMKKKAIQVVVEDAGADADDEEDLAADLVDEEKYLPRSGLRKRHAKQTLIVPSKKHKHAQVSQPQVDGPSADNRRHIDSSPQRPTSA
ncbi:hypothetical protein LXA43DRAFT_1096455 [Ganoderma leucocontextum]|nr:hypothetical protein LXA43DRAFT_1096455 [Ganoderma leucocontextum]